MSRRTLPFWLCFSLLSGCDAGTSTDVDAGADFGIGAQILADLGLSTIRILTNRARKLPGLDAFGIRITDQVPLCGE